MWKKRIKKTSIFIFLIGTVYWLFFMLPYPLFKDPSSTVITDANGHLLSAHIADDGQWRFPERKTVPWKFAVAITQFEDRNFFRHSGLHLPSLLRAFWQNLTSGEVVSGGSTISMQVIRLSRKGKSRSLAEKVVELFMAMRLEMGYSKEEILAMYASHAPFGGNVVGLDAAAWRYFGRPADDLSWSEVSTLAVLPNAPALIYPGRNQDDLQKKRNKLIQRLYTINVIDQEDSELAMAEALPQKPHPLPGIAPHLLTRVLNDGKKGQNITVTLDGNLQKQVNNIVARHHEQLSASGIENAAVLVLDVNTGEVLSYVGNTPGSSTGGGHNVDIITAPRSTGSILKPFLYAGMLNDGEILPQTLVADIPIQLEGFNPKNYNYTYDGAVPAHQALSRSLNIPAVMMLREYGIEKFLFLLERLDQKRINNSAAHYGLSLILGGAESNLWDICGAYASMSRTLNTWHESSGFYRASDFKSPSYLPTEKPVDATEKNGLLSADAVWLTWQALQKVNRPQSEIGWEDYSSTSRVAWKTGTSWGNRDAWAIGTTRNYVVGVWTGNADGEGKPNMTGVGAAAPIMFDVLGLLPSDPWFPAPYDIMAEAEVCKQSGQRALDICPEKATAWIQQKGLETPPCQYHQLVHLTAAGDYRTSSDCTPPNQIRTEAWFVLPPVQEWYYKQRHPAYRVLPPIDPNCDGISQKAPMAFIYPDVAAAIYVPIELDGSPGEAVFEVAHRKEGMTLFWHLDESYLGHTKSIHQMGVKPAMGFHTLVVVDSEGNELVRRFEVLSE